jgi:hypothetical protein
MINLIAFATSVKLPPGTFSFGGILVTEADIFLLLFVLSTTMLSGILILYMWGMQGLRKFWRPAGLPILWLISSDGTYRFYRLTRLRKNMMMYNRNGREIVIRVGKLSSYIGPALPRIYPMYEDAEATIDVRLIPWIKEIISRLSKKWDFTPRTWEQFALLYYKDFATRAIKEYEDNAKSNLKQRFVPEQIEVMRNDLELIKEIESKKQRPVIDKTTGKQRVDPTTKKPLFYPKISFIEKEALVDRAEERMMDEHGSDFAYNGVDMSYAVMFRRATFDDTQLEFAYNEGKQYAMDVSKSTLTRIMPWAIAAAIVIFAGSAGLYLLSGKLIMVVPTLKTVAEMVLNVL